MDNKQSINEKLNELHTTLEDLNNRIKEGISSIAKAYLGKEIEHKTLGKGKVIDTEKSIIYIEFKDKSVKKFKIPDSFINNFLIADDINLNKMNNIVNLAEEKEQLSKEIITMQIALDEIKNGKKIDLSNVVCKEAKQCIEKGYISVEDDVEFRTIRDVSDLFNKNYKGTQKSWIPVDSDWQRVASCYQMESSTERNIYSNILTADGKCFYYFSNEDNDLKKEEKVREFIKNGMTKTYLFLKYPNSTGYKFYGVFEKDVEAMEKSIKNNEYKVVYKKVDDKLELRQFFN